MQKKTRWRPISQVIHFFCEQANFLPGFSIIIIIDKYDTYVALFVVDYCFGSWLSAIASLLMCVVDLDDRGHGE